MQGGVFILGPMTRVFALAVFLLLSAGFTGGVWYFAYSQALDQLSERGESDLSLASDRLVSQLQQYRELAVLMADHPVLHAALEQGGDLNDAQDLLLRTADKTGTLDLHLVDAAGQVVVSSDRLGTAPQSRADNPSFQRAMQGALGAHHERTSGLAERAFIFTAPVFGPEGLPVGAVSVDVNIWAVESAWVGDAQAVYFTDEAGVIFITNRTELLFRTRGHADAAAFALFGYDPEKLDEFIDFRPHIVNGNEVWAINAGPYIPSRALHLTKPLPIIEMTGELLLDAAPAARVAALQAAVAAALSVVFGATLLLLSQRRRALADRLALEAAANAELEHRVARRTRELSRANENLRREITERKEAEAALKKAQQDLVQAGKLSALGNMSAGLSHELNQPLMAIQTFAENGTLFLERGKADRAADNLGRISDLARRMGRIIKNLRAFARQESEPAGTVDLVGVVDAVLEISEARIAGDGVVLNWTRPEAPILVRGGEVRLQQVVLNLVSNAMDAMGASERRELALEIGEQGGSVFLYVRDTGPGIKEPEKIFDPFYTTKEVGLSEGMGLGLSISYGLVQSFGGAIRGRNRDTGGAEFAVELTAAGLESAA